MIGIKRDTYGLLTFTGMLRVIIMFLCQSCLLDKISRKKLSIIYRVGKIYIQKEWIHFNCSN